MSWEHKGYNIDINQDGKFTAVVNDNELFDTTLDGVKAKIEAEAAKKKRLLNIPAIGVLSFSGYGDRARKASRDGEIVRVTVTGVNRTTRGLLCRSGQVPSDCSLTQVVPDTPEMEKLLLRRREIQRLEEKAKELLDQYRLDGYQGHYGRIEAADYDKKLDEIQATADKSKDFKLGDQLVDKGDQ